MSKDIKQIAQITLQETKYTASGDLRPCVSGEKVYEFPGTEMWYSLVPICKSRWQSGRYAGELCLNPADTGTYHNATPQNQRFTCSRHKKHNDSFIPVKRSNDNVVESSSDESSTEE